MNILSLDFDYFQIVSKETLTHYPDGVDNQPSLSEFVWASHYANPLVGNKIRRVRADKWELLHTAELLLKQREETPVLISYTHKDIYSFIHDLADTSEPLTVVNVDMHHDMFNDNETLDCGNWLSHIKKEYKTKLYWVVNEVSLDMYEAPELKPLVLRSVKDIPDMKFDGIFLCRSDTWLPPHLDKQFELLKNTLAQYFHSVRCSNLCMKPRTEYKKIAKTQAEFEKKMWAKYNSRKNNR